MASKIIFGPWVGGITSGSAIIKAAVDKNASAMLIPTTQPLGVE